VISRLLLLPLETHLRLLGGVALLLLLLVAAENLPTGLLVTVLTVEDPIGGEICLREHPWLRTLFSSNYLLLLLLRVVLLLV